MGAVQSPYESGSGMNIALVCAFPSGANPGMLSVDLAFESVREKAGHNINVTQFCAEGKLTLGNDNVAIDYESLESQEQLRFFDKILYWGDFHHWIAYANGDWLKRWQNREPTRSKDDIIDAWYKLFLLEDAEDIQGRVAIFGSTLYGLTGHQLLDVRYRAALESLLINARLVLMRDHVSANFVEQLAPNRVSTFGCDCALLLDARRLSANDERHPTTEDGAPYIVCSFGRSGAKSALRAFGVALAAQRKLKVVNLEWLGPHGLDGLISKLSIIKKAQFVVTDIYHLSVTAWRENVPALCVGKGVSNVTGTLSDKKKEIFYRQIFASDKYMYLEDILAALGSDKILAIYCERFLERIEDQQSNAFISDAIERQKKSALSRLLKFICE
jgi:Polysaccharide pyruvyl transferase